MKTYLAKTGEIEREYILFDASEAPVGRLAVRIANALRGKSVFTGRKGEEKVYVDYTGYRSGYKERTAKELRGHNPERFIKDAVWGMMPHGRLGRAQFSKLKVYAGAEHPHTAQQPKKITVK